MKYLKYLRSLILIGLLVLTRSAFAYNFLFIHPTTGEPLKWDNTQTIKYWLDPGSLGRLTNDQAHTLLKEAMKIWENASSNANPPRFEFAGYLPEDVNGANYADYVSLFPCYTDDLSSCPSQAQKDLKTVIVFDEDDSILDNELCRIGGCSASAGASVFSGTSRNIVQGILVLGTFAGSTSSEIVAVVGQMVHELGHLLGLAHTSVNQQIEFENLSAENRFLPTMYTSISLIAGNNVFKRQATLTPDDVSGISVLYPSDTFIDETATIRGEILKSDGSPMMHVNVIARNVDDPLCEAYSYLSGRFCRYSTSELCVASGEPGYDDPSYRISGLPPGSYTLEVEEVADDDLARTLAPGLIDPFLYGDSEFWNEGDQSNEDSLLSSAIDLSAGQEREDVDIILNRNQVTSSRVQYIPLEFYNSGTGTNCLDEPEIDYASLVGISETSSEDNNDTTPIGNDDGVGEEDPNTTNNAPSSGGCSLSTQ